MTSKIEEYLDIYDKYKKKYNNIVILIEIGSFYEIYQTNDRGPDIDTISNIIDVQVTKKNKYINEISLKNPKMCGFPVFSSVDRISKLVNNGYSVIVMDQITKIDRKNNKLKKYITRKITNIYTPGTLITENTNNIIICIYLTNELQKNNKKYISVAMSSCNIINGKCYINEAHGNNSDDNYAIDELSRFIDTLNPAEVIIYNTNLTQKQIYDIIERLDIDCSKYKIFDKINDNFIKPAYQNNIFKKIYKNITNITPIEYFDLHKLPYASSCFSLLLQYIYEHNEHMVDNIHEPIQFRNDNIMIIGNNGLKQLNVVDNGDINFSIKTGKKTIKSLFDIVDNTSTSMGKRYLYERLTTPLVDINKLNNLYDLNDEIIKNNRWKKIEEILNHIGDVEKLGKKILLLSIIPTEFCKFIQSIEYIVSLYNYLVENKILLNSLPNQKQMEKLKKLYKKQKKIFNFDELCKCNINDIRKSFFNNNIFEEIDELQNKIDSGLNIMNNLKLKIEELNCEKYKLGKIYLKHSDRDGFYLTTSYTSFKNLEKILKNIKQIKLNGDVIINTNKLTFISNKHNVKILVQDIKQESTKIDQYKDILFEKIKLLYIENLNNIAKKYYELILNISNFIAFADFIKSNSKTCVLNNYIRPTIKKNANSFIDCKQLRHPIIEKIINHTYVPHDINIGINKTRGILLYGLNACGKSSVMKAVGLSIIMAQSGMFVPASKYVFHPYHALYTRINGSDNIFKGLSSFSCEMLELKSILKRASNDTLVIGDEICRGTEHISGTSIIGASIITLYNKKTSFLFATHLHNLVSLNEIKKLKELKIYHLSVDYTDNEIIYNRILKEGSGDNIYGILVANHIINNNDFNKLVFEFKNEILENSKLIVNTKKSKYNSNIYLDKCELCGIKNNINYPKLDVHHIIPQNDKKNKDKNKLSNLIVLCKKCHNDLHNKKKSIKKITSSHSIKINVSKNK